MNIVGVTIGSYPTGEATTNRVLSILKGLSENGCNVELLVLTKTRKKTANGAEREGEIDGVKYKYTSSSLEVPGNIIKWLVMLFVSVITSIKLINKKHKKEKIDALFVLINEPFLILPFIAFAKFKKIKVFHEQTETPEIIYKDTFTDRKVLKFYLKVVSKMDGIYVISHYLKEYYSRCLPEEKICVVNMTVDPSRFLVKKESPFNFPYIAYCGTMYGDKDGVSDLIEAFNLIKNEVKHKLVLIGDIQDQRALYVIEKVKKNNLENKVILTGSISSNQIPQYIQNAELLMLFRPDNVQAKGGFPTKLGEYLLTGKPVLVTPVGDIPKYLTDNLDVFFSPAGEVEKFAKRIKVILNNYEESLKVAENGKNIALRDFNYSIESKKLLNFVSAN